MATPTYTELATALNSAAFLDRCTIAVVKYARYIVNEDPATVNHQRRYSWATSAIQSPSGVISNLKWDLIIDSAFADQNPLNIAGTSDAVIQAAVEATINSTILVF